MSLSLPLLVELGTEELPPKALDELALAFRDGVVDGLVRRGIAVDANTARALWTPRRLAVQIGAVPAQQPDQAVERRGPAVAAGFDGAGKPTRALVGFAQSCGVDIAALARVATDKGEWFVHRAIRRGEPTATLLPLVVAEALQALPVPRPMRWGDREVAFVRPVHWLVMLLGDKVVEGEVLGLRSDRMSRGHRFMGNGKPVWISTADGYVDALRAANVVVDPVERRALIERAVEATADDLGGRARATPALLDEVKNLVEWPAPIACAFDREFLRVPQEALVMTMETNQKFFPVLDAEGRLTERFIGIANIESRNPGEVRRGYERVIRPRFADAAFFFDDDLKTPLTAHQEALRKVTYQQRLGSIWDKCCRVAELARVIANRTGVDGALATKAAALSKCDLMTRMVGEFPELQGTMGRHYAVAQGLETAVAAALDEHYRPRFAGDAIAGTPLGRVLAIADKLDTLAGLFAIGNRPTGNKDPFSLRRAALGLARTLIEGELTLDLAAQISEAFDLARKDIERIERERVAGGGKPDPAAPARDDAADLLAFVFDRLRGYYADQGIRGDAFDAVLALRPTDLTDFDRRLRAVVAFVALPESQALAAANKRIVNILRQAAEKGDRPAPNIDATALEMPEERALAAALSFQGDLAAQKLRSGDYVGALRQLSTLRPAVDAFFDKVMVMAEDPDIRHNRMAVLDDLRSRFLLIADIGLLQPA
ncbi:MAG: glycine--tRNA ligase subunit beta [Pseudomonadota bacterium]